MAHGRPYSYEEENLLSTERDQFAQLLEQFDHAFKRGDIVKGRVLTVESNGATVDIGAKTAAFLPNKEIGRRDEENTGIKVGEEYEFFIIKEDPREENQLTLSLKRVQAAQVWQDLEALMEKEEILECPVTSLVKGGLLVDIKGLRGFVPSSHIRSKNNLESMVGETLPLKIITLDQQRNNIILSHRKVMADQQQEQRQAFFKDIEEGTVIEGEVVRLTDFGAFVDLGGMDGLLPLSQMSWRWVEHPSDVLKVGDKVKVEVIGLDSSRQRVSLSMKTQMKDPWEEVAESMRLGDTVEGTITRIKNFGAFVEIHPGVEALLPSKDMMDYEQMNNGEKLEPNQKITVHIVKFNPEERRISLSFQALRDSMAMSGSPD